MPVLRLHRGGTRSRNRLALTTRKKFKSIYRRSYRFFFFLLIEVSRCSFLLLHISDLALWASVTRWFLKELPCIACLEALVPSRRSHSSDGHQAGVVSVITRSESEVRIVDHFRTTISWE